MIKYDTCDMVDQTFEVAERIASYLLEASRIATDLPDHATNGRDHLAWASFQIRTNAWRAGWERDPATTDPREPKEMSKSTVAKRRSDVKQLCHEAFFAGRSNGGDSCPADSDYEDILKSSELAFEAWWSQA